MKIFVCACAALMLGVCAAGAQGMGKLVKEQELLDLENAWSKAIVQKDMAKVSSIVADDWMGQDDTGSIADKAKLLREMQSPRSSVTSMVNRDMHARIVHGGVGIVQGSDDEKSMSKGRDTSGSYTWMDVFAMRGGEWKVIASQITKVKKAK